ncbi:dethiobiotin synthase [Dokdonia sinensis]|uniref:ATP-dependent dethiobiotin synthetase BioD n=1 Tax=Dokdonia sinensis TaxID=2479847 RepID=A0A3M0FUT0_9FLAO|nr:dethiobiotin synthase [Dokdonia sinensis]RMB56411.1 dethiobiotin synthase [Dokdonia sinensis]
MKNQTYFITGISTDVGKTIAAAIITEALKADYWKPVQAGDLDNSDTHKVKRLVKNDISQYHDNTYALKTPMSPHAAAAIDGVTIKATDFKRPKTKNNLVIEGAGGLLVPLNDTETIIDLIQPTDKVIVVSRHYLGSINHTLMTIEILKSRGFKNIGILFSGEEHPTTESIIKKMTEVTIIGRIDEEPYFDQNVVCEYAEELREGLVGV